MLKQLYIKNFALIDELSLSFENGLNIITGETGAGKSVIVDGLLLALGERASSVKIPEGVSKSIIEAIFDISGLSDLKHFLDENEIETGDSELILRREISAKGTSRCFISDSPVQLSILSKAGDYLVDFHGQHEHQALLRKENHIGILDKIAETTSLKNTYSMLYNQLKQQIKSYDNIVNEEANLSAANDEYELELTNIRKINPVPDELDSLNNELSIIQNHEVILNLTGEIIDILSESEVSVISKLNYVLKLLNQLAKIDTKFENFIDEIKSTFISINELASFTKNYQLNIDVDSEKLETIRERIQLLNGLRKKYGSVENAINRASFLSNELDKNIDIEGRKQTLIDSIVNIKSELAEICEKLSLERSKTSEIVSDAIVKSLKSLGIEKGNFVVSMEKFTDETPSLSSLSVRYNDKYYILNTEGFDKVEFFISTNSGEQPKPLAEVASGGEVSRVMLSLKKVLQKTTEVPVMIFDEIDTGISGRIAQKVGFAMKELSSQCQIIAITHLAQIAALGDSNVGVYKSENDEITRISASKIQGKDKLIEIAKLISGDSISDISIKHAQELIEQGADYAR